LAIPSSPAVPRPATRPPRRAPARAQSIDNQRSTTRNGETLTSSRHYAHRVTVAPTGAPDPDAPLRAPLTFEAADHDDMLAIVERGGATIGLEPDDAAAALVGLKLLAGVTLKEKANPLFDPLREGVRAFILSLKGRRGQ
jgi:hypothetical protein